MSQQFDPYEPLPDHLADTGPIRRVQEVAPWRRAVGFISLIGAAGLTIATALLILRPAPATPVPNPIAPTTAPTTVENVTQPTSVPQTNSGNPTQNALVQNVSAPLNPGVIAQLLSTPIAPIDQQVGLEIPRDDFSPFTIIPDRPRSEVIEYTIQSGDTIFAIAQRYGLKPETIAWSNDRAITEGLRPGKTLNILPVDGVYFTVTADTTIDNIAKQYHVDPYTVIDSEYNDLFGDTPDTKLPSGTKVVLPGGTAEQIAWTPPVQHVSGTSSGGKASGDMISFDIGDPGSCGLVSNAGGGGGWLKPLATYQWVRGFSSVHSGVDLSDPIGTPIMAANGGTVMFAGWSNWGYGWSVVVASGPFSEVYGHMSSVIANCGAHVNAGQVIGLVGQSGNATGPHLHFEIRYNDIPTDPTSTMPF